jgi:hypothetical protein
MSCREVSLPAFVCTGKVGTMGWRIGDKAKEKEKADKYHPPFLFGKLL